MKVNDILLEDYDLKITEGDFATGESTAQHIELLLLSAPGWWRYAPLSGFALNSYLKEEALPSLNDLQEALEGDGLYVKKLTADLNGLIIEAEYV